MKFWTQMVLDVYFECERCNSQCCTPAANFGFGRRAFCDNCGACYVLYTSSDGERTIDRITFGEVYLPPLQWNEIYIDGLNKGVDSEIDRRTRHRTFRQRLGDFIRNR